MLSLRQDEDKECEGEGRSLLDGESDSDSVRVRGDGGGRIDGEEAPVVVEKNPGDGSIGLEDTVVITTTILPSAALASLAATITESGPIPGGVKNTLQAAVTLEDTLSPSTRHRPHFQHRYQHQ